MQSLFKAAHWGALCLVAVSTGCVKVDTEAPPKTFHCDTPGTVPVSTGSGWECDAPSSLQPTALTANTADTAADAGSASYADHADTAALADGLGGYYGTIALTDAGTSPGTVRVDAPFLVQGFPVPSRLEVPAPNVFDVTSSTPQAIATYPLNPPPGAHLHFRLTGRVYGEAQAPSWDRCDLVLKVTIGSNSLEFGRLLLSTNTDGTFVYFDRVLDYGDSLELEVVDNGSHTPSNSSKGCYTTSSDDLSVMMEVIR